VIESPEGVPVTSRWSVYASYVLAIGMMVCFAITSILLAQRFFPDWDSRGLTVFCTLAAIEAVLSYWLIKHLAIAQRQPGFFRLSEWLIFAVIVKLFTELHGGASQLASNVLQWPLNFPFNIFSGSYVLNLLLVFLTWRASTYFATDLYLLELDEAARTDQRVVTTPIRNLVLRRFLVLGMLVVFMAGTLLGNEPESDQTYWGGKIVPPVVIFFVVGLALVSLTRFANLESLWRQEQVEVPAHVPRRWVLYSSLVIAVLIVLAVWLPTNYGLGFTAVVVSILRALYAAAYFLYGLILLVYTYVMQLFAKATGTGESENGVLPLETPPALTAPPAPAMNLDLVRNLIVWTLVGALVIIVLRQYISFNKELAEELKRFGPLRWLAALWRSLKVSLRRANRAVGAFVEGGLERLRGIRSGRNQGGDWDDASPRRLNPRQKIFFYYLAMLRRGEDTGVPRREGQTPYEYARSLGAEVKEAREDVDALTDSFVEARYSNHDIASNAAHRVESVWQRIRRLLQERRNRRQGDSSRQDS
jgi:hypothetical protein